MDSEHLTEEIRTAIAGYKRPIVVAISGAAALGKSTFSIALANSLAQYHINRVSIVSTDGFLMDRQRRKENKISGYDPAAMDIERLGNTVEVLLAGRSVFVPTYDHSNGTVVEKTTRVCPGEVTIVDGIHSTHARILTHVNYVVFFDSDKSTAIRLRRFIDTRERGYLEEDAQEAAFLEYQAYLRHVKSERHIANIVVRVTGMWQYTVITEKAL